MKEKNTRINCIGNQKGNENFRRISGCGYRFCSTGPNEFISLGHF